MHHRQSRCIGIRVLLILFVIGGSVSFAYSQSPVAVVRSVDGKALVKETQTAKSVELKKGDNVFAGQWVSCARGCKELTISQCQIGVPVTAWTQILAINCFPRKGTRGGRAKGVSGSILSPKDSERLQPETLSLSWQPFNSERKVELSLKIYLGEKIWGPETVDGRKGSFDSPSLRKALKDAQKAGHLIIVLALDDGKNPTQRVKFYLISSEDQQNLWKDLARFARTRNGIVRAMGQGSVFGEYELYTAAAKEFERALAIGRRQRAETSTLAELNTLAIQANYMAYDDTRVQELCKSWSVPNSPLPDACARIQ